MELHLTGKNFEVTPAIKNYVTEKIQKIKRRNDSATHLSIVLAIENVTHIAEATLKLHGSPLHASAQEDDMYKAIDALIDKLVAQVDKFKEKTSNH